ncbi:MAG: GNAT family N-acetyltransferase [Bacteroidetes bacterium]|jgi:phosphinothricin acetyltransferase|nr:GNAT family N-acetyltransferase [Bacteroidota bacterium]
MKIRIVSPDDADQILSIYKPIVEQTAISFQVTPPSVQEMANKIHSTIETYPWIVAENDELITGYSYATHHRSREAYQWSVEPSIYVRQGYKKSGIATQLYQSLFEVLRLQGYFKAIAIITMPNRASIEFHKKMGFSNIGTIHKAGYKFNQWHDTSWWEYQLQDKNKKRPEEIKPFNEFRKSVSI